MWNYSNKFQHFKMCCNYCTKLNYLPEPVTQKNKEFVTYQKLLKRCENFIAKHI